MNDVESAIRQQELERLSVGSVDIFVVNDSKEDVESVVGSFDLGPEFEVVAVISRINAKHQDDYQNERGHARVIDQFLLDLVDPCSVSVVEKLMLLLLLKPGQVSVLDWLLSTLNRLVGILQ